ncbi:MAG TPA: RNA polymerase sigma factor [Pyrinomonadaceae bacterium]|nr:RNA polymerase sigma factor [Pyrinomonadaceae bacterium]
MEISESTEAGDRRLVRKFIRNRDERSFRSLYRRHTPTLYRLALRLAGGIDADAQDLIQDTWFRACGSLAEFHWKSGLRTWLTGILINCARELSRRHQRRNEEELVDSELSGPSANGNVTEVEQAIQRLSEGCRYVLTLHDIEGYTHEEMSVLLEISAGTSKSQLHYARQILRSALRKDETKDERNGQ